MIEDPEEAAFRTLGGWERPGPSRGAEVLLHDPAGRVLMQLRDDVEGIAYPGVWTVFGGGVEEGETLREAALREIEEEVGVTLDSAALSPFARSLSSWGTWRRRLYYFTAPVAFGPEALVVREGAGAAFMTPAQVAAHPVIPETKAVVAALALAMGWGPRGAAQLR